MWKRTELNVFLFTNSIHAKQLNEENQFDLLLTETTLGLRWILDAIKLDIVILGHKIQPKRFSKHKSVNVW